MAQQQKNKHRKRFRVLIEIVFMALGILCAIMPAPFPLLVPIAIGTIRIISNAVKKDGSSEPPIVYCNGHKAPDIKDSPKKERRSEKTKESCSKKAGGKTGKK